MENWIFTKNEGLEDLVLVVAFVLEHAQVLQMVLHPDDNRLLNLLIILAVIMCVIGVNLSHVFSGLFQPLHVGPEHLLQPFGALVEILDFFPEVEVLVGQPRDLMLETSLGRVGRCLADGLEAKLQDLDTRKQPNFVAKY